MPSRLICCLLCLATAGAAELPFGDLLAEARRPPERTGLELPPAERVTRSFEFPAELGRLRTGLFIKRGEEVEIVATGRWTMWSPEYGLSNANGHRVRAGLFSWGRLMARVGGGQAISVGTQRRWTSSDEGELVLYANVEKYGLRSGAGALAVTIAGGRPVEEVIDFLARRGVKVTVPATSDGVITDIWVNDDELVTLQAFGEWRMHAGGEWLTADGDLTRPLTDGTPWGRLVARFGGPTFSTGETIMVGARRSIRPRRGGLLELRPAVGEFAGHERAGAVTVIILGGRRADETLRELGRRRATDDERTLAFLRLHQLRYALRLPNALGSPELMRAAQAHADYLARHGATGHGEDLALPGATGASPEARAKRFGFVGRLAGEMIHGYVDGAAGVDGLWATVYHRVPLLDPAAAAYGVGIAAGRRPALVVLAGIPPVVEYPQRMPAVVVYPLENQVHCPTTWTGQEDPSPFATPPVGPVGYPLSLSLTRGDITRVVSAQLLDRRQRPVAATVVGPGTDPRERLVASVFVIPAQPLEKLSTYHCRIALETSEGPVEKSWSFTTGLGNRPLLGTPQLALAANPPVELGR